MKRLTLIAGLILAGCCKPTSPSDNTTAVSALRAQVTILEKRVATLETQANKVATVAPQPDLLAPAKAELRVLDGFNSPPHDYPTMKACMQAKSVIEAQFAQKEAEYRSQGEMLNPGTASCLPL